MITTAAPEGQAYVGTRVGLSVADLGHRDQVGFTGVTQPVQPELTKCMAPGTFLTVRDGDFTVRDADHWQVPQPVRPPGSQDPAPTDGVTRIPCGFWWLRRGGPH